MSKTYINFVRFVNRMAAKNDAENFLRLTEHPEKRDLGEESVKKLFARAPFESFEELVAIPGISQDMLDASIEALSFNNNAASGVGDFTIESDFILDEPLLLVDQFYSAELSIVNPVAGAELIAVVDCM